MAEGFSRQAGQIFTDIIVFISRKFIAAWRERARPGGNWDYERKHWTRGHLRANLNAAASTILRSVVWMPVERVTRLPDITEAVQTLWTALRTVKVLPLLIFFTYPQLPHPLRTTTYF